MRYRYGSLGRLIAGINHGGRVELEWNAAGQLTLERSLIRGVSHEPHHQYDERGNRTTKLKARHTQQQFRWNTEQQLAEAVTVRNGAAQRTTYGYDAFGRRSWKQDAFGVTTFVWDGNRLLSETHGGRSYLWIYETTASRRWCKSAWASK
nr:hypothetical protein [Cronobacter dublinensis]